MSASNPQGAMAPQALDALATEMLGAWDHAELVDLPSARPAGLSFEQGFDVAARVHALREARGERRVGWKIGFTNRTIWPRYGVNGPIWGPVWNGTLQQQDSAGFELSLAGLVQPRIEPEVVFGFARAPEPGMDLPALQQCLQWVAHGFEIVHTHYEGWRFTAGDGLADFALHGRLLVGPRVPVQGWTTMAEDLSALELELVCDGETRDRGLGRNVLDGPLQAVKAWVDEMARLTPGWRVQPGEVVTTGTLTDAHPLQPGQRWQTRLSSPRLAGLSLQLRA